MAESVTWLLLGSYCLSCHPTGKELTSISFAILALLDTLTSSALVVIKGWQVKAVIARANKTRLDRTPGRLRGLR